MTCQLWPGVNCDMGLWSLNEWGAAGELGSHSIWNRDTEFLFHTMALLSFQTISSNSQHLMWNLFFSLPKSKGGIGRRGTHRAHKTWKSLLESRCPRLFPAFSTPWPFGLHPKWHQHHCGPDLEMVRAPTTAPCSAGRGLSPLGGQMLVKNSWKCYFRCTKNMFWMASVHDKKATRRLIFGCCNPNLSLCWDINGGKRSNSVFCSLFCTAEAVQVSGAWAVSSSFSC